VTFLFTDVEGSTRLWVSDEAAMSRSLVVHDELVRGAIESHGGFVFSTGGDGFAAVFSRASDAVAAAQAVQAALANGSWPGPSLRVRVGLHLGEADERSGDYFGPAVSTAARVASAGHGGQILLTEPVRSTARVDAVDLGVHELRDLKEPLRLYQLGDEGFPPLRVVDPLSTNLPARPTRLIGRHDEVANVRKLLSEFRLVTVTAVGGAGKTRVAIAVGEAELPHCAGGVWFVDLTAVTSDADVVLGVARAVGVTLQDGDPTDQVVEYLADEAALVILDNCEHVIVGCAEFAERFLAVRGRAVLLATSREALGVDGERVFALSTLAADSGDDAAVRLFLDRATGADSRFSPDDVTIADVVDVCRHLDGLPLAIELAAARVTVMSVAELNAGLRDRFALLGGTRRRHRQRTLLATLEWSYDLLSVDEQRVLRSLAVFVAGFDLDAVSTVANMSKTAALATVEALTAKSLTVHTAAGSRSRFSLLETVQAYAEDRLIAAGEPAAARDRHLDHFYTLATVQGHGGIAELRLGAALRSELGNLTAAFEWAALTSRWKTAGELIAACYSAYILDGAAMEARALIERALGGLASDQTALADCLRRSMVMTSAWLNDWSLYERMAGELTRSPMAETRAFGLLALGVASPFSDVETSNRQLAKARAELASLTTTTPDVPNEFMAGLIRWVEGRVSAAHGDLEAGLEGILAFLATCRAIDYFPTTTPRAAKLAAACQILLGDPASAIETVAWLESFDISTFNCDDIRALALLAQGDLTDAQALIRAHATRGLTGPMRGQVCDSALLLSVLAYLEADHDTARHLLLEMGIGLEPATIVYSSHLAAWLDVAVEHNERQQLALNYNAASPQGISGTRMAAAAVREELTRRGWT
jgi:predicted ATPase